MRWFFDKTAVATIDDAISAGGPSALASPLSPGYAPAVGVRKPSPVRVVVVMGCCAALAGGCGGNDEPDTAAELEEIAATVERPIERLAAALDEAKPSKLVVLRATAERTADALVNARRDVRDLEDRAPDRERARLREFEAALDEYEALADSLAESPLTPAEVEISDERAQQAAQDSRVELSELDAGPLVAVLRKARRDRKPRVAGGLSAPVGPAAPAGDSQPTSYTTYTGPSFQARIPTGGGWAAPSQSQPTPGELFRTNVRGPNGLFVAIDFTPFEPATFGGRYQSRTEVGQTAFGSATLYVFQGGVLPECQRNTCFDYIINSGQSGGSGFAVVAGGEDQATAAAIAQTVAESVTPIGQYLE